MPSIKSIKRRITSVKATKKIMKAMNMVAASKLQKIKVQLDAARSLFNEMKRITRNIENCEEAIGHIFVEPRQVNNNAYIVVTSDRGLCGGLKIGRAHV